MLFTPAEVEKVFKSTQNKIKNTIIKKHLKYTQLQVKVLYSNFTFSIRIEVLSAKCIQSIKSKGTI